MVRTGEREPGHQQNYVTANRFYIEMEDTLAAWFSECSSVGVQLKKEVIHEGGVNEQQRVLLGQAEFTDVTLKRGITDSLAFWNWICEILAGKPKKRRNVNILLFNQAGETMQCWTLIGAVPIAWKTPALQANSSTVAIEELTLAYEGLRVERSSKGGVDAPSQGRDKVGYFPGSS